MSKYSFFMICTLAFVILENVKAATVESVSDDDLIHLIKSESNVVVFFSKKHCDECDTIEGHLNNLKDDFKQNLDAILVKAHGSQVVRLYSPTKEPAIVFFRHGIPLLYDGPLTEDAILHNFIDGKEPAVKELSDSNFEHLTQASTGSTTGDWLVMFYSPDCVECQRLHAVWEAVGVALKNRANVARVNRISTGPSTANRFGIKKSPEFLLVRQGKFYKYEINKYDVKSFVSFAQEWYKNVRSEKITVPSSPFDDLVATSVEYLKVAVGFGHKFYNENPYIILFIALGFGLTVLAVLFTKHQAGKKTNKEVKKKAK